MLFNIVKASMTPIAIFIATILFISTIQWTAVQFMATHCASWGWMGPILNLMTLGSPVCMFVNHVQVALADSYITIWVSAGTATITWIGSRINVKKNQ